MPETSTTRWAARHDALRPAGTHDFNDLARIITAYYDMYQRASAFLAPWNAKQIGNNFPYRPPEREQVRQALGKPKPWVSERAYVALIEAVINFSTSTRGRRQLITPNPITHHSAQFPAQTFSITKVDADIKLFRPRGAKPPEKLNGTFSISLFGAAAPIFIENLTVKPEKINFLIVRPRLGKLGTPTLSRWEILLYCPALGYLIDHVDSEINPRWSGII